MQSIRPLRTEKAKMSKIVESRSDGSADSEEVLAKPLPDDDSFLEITVEDDGFKIPEPPTIRRIFGFKTDEDSDADDESETSMTLQEMAEQFIGIDEIKLMVDRMRREIEIKFKVELKELETNISSNIEDAKADLIKQVTKTTEKRLSKTGERLDNDVKTMFEDFQNAFKQCNEEMGHGFSQFVKKRLCSAKEDIFNDLELGEFTFKRKKPEIQSTDSVEPVTTKNVNEQILSVEIQENLPMASTLYLKKINWKVYPAAEQYILDEHEKFKFGRSATVQEQIFSGGVNRGLWEDNSLWKKRVKNKLDTSYKASALLAN